MRPRTASILFVAVAVLASCWPLLAGRRIAFRDVSHFYLPLYEYVGERTSAERLPLWNPLDHTGMPLAGETSTAVFYPPRYLLFRSSLTPEAAMNGYLIVHLLLAGFGALWLARRCRCTWTGATAAGIVYPLSGAVFSLCCNPPFLVGAAWLPWMIGACQITRGRRLPVTRQIALVGAALAAMVLGGDPQSAVHGILVVSAVSIVRLVPVLRAEGRSWRRVKRCLRPFGVCCAGALLASLLSCVQIAASLDWSRQSSRAVSQLGDAERYDFSLPPWHALELFAARPFGTPFPDNSRTSVLIPGDGRMWTPTIYAGAVSGFAFLALAVFSRRRAGPWGWISIVSLLLCFGHFGPVWLFQQLPGWLEDTSSAVGGAYWWLCQCLPPYQAFRYPVKWLPVLSVATSMLVAQWLSTPPGQNEARGLRRLGTVYLLAAGVVYVALRMFAMRHAGSWPADEYWGPLDLSKGIGQAFFSWAGALLVLTLVVWCRFHARIEERDHASVKDDSSGWFAVAGGQAAFPARSVLILMVIAIDCGVNALSLLPTVSIREERAGYKQNQPSDVAMDRAMRTQDGMWPDEWRQQSGTMRPLEVAIGERMAWFGRWHLADSQAVLNSMVSIRSKANASFWRESQRRLRDADEQQRKRYWRTARRWLGVDGVSHVDGHVENQVLVNEQPLTLPAVTRAQIKGGDGVRSWSRWTVASSMEALTGELLAGRVPLPSLSGGADAGDSDGATSERSYGPPLESSQADSGEAEVRLTCQSTCLVERCVYQDGNWVASIENPDTGETRPLTVLRSGFLNQAVLVPEGNWLIRFEYQPWWQWPAMAGSVAGMVLLMVFLVLPNQRPRSRVRGIVFF